MFSIKNITITAIFIFNISSVSASLLGECNSAASIINRSSPQAVDQYTTLLNAICYQDAGAVVLQYRNRVGLPSGSVDQSKLNSLKPGMISMWCTDPTQRATLNLVDIQYTYVDSSGKYIGKIDIKKRDCR